MLAEMLVTTAAAQCMLWQTSPAATEMEGVMADWLRQAMGSRWDDGGHSGQCILGHFVSSSDHARAGNRIRQPRRPLGKGNSGSIVPIRCILY